jgi:hypothetical protein
LGGRDQWWQIDRNCRLHDAVCSVEVSVCQVIAHSGAINPGDVWLMREQSVIKPAALEMAVAAARMSVNR